uniref:Uncharacterized protein n=1 Tax=Chlamydomonas leiostraca TaxID=1034604 RepID=A0A7S0S6E9_9CHLO|mmetsp:Transcript_9759/g.24302  ORF Transcript_9759/g.24302 Transcript_9759/m.24302 type:complete len:1038 (+) Transcript_9759:76-3189(+)|eukprot:CAMPEP_0202867856 /NCGR_PEP_ID=MMETSP1391-20130828/9661_1 /ASSEMBLY_ACC=CAM_ASM_000867 /TAXON_ID=1034604 /ORGANISM="Chlamydomonas leiostraca, Strain SAG 11-49" /LENGTH=1037 /DNA_ID=CAMNT_0049547933 /DNA_START=74 /DNA_END=3187 /DNA_ORIENTATION=-
MAQLAGKQATLLRGPRLPQIVAKPIRGIRPARAAAAEVEAPAPAPIPNIKATEEPERAKPFPYPLPMDPQQKMVSGLPTPLFYPALLAFIGGAGLVGSLGGQALPVEPENKDVASYATAAVGAAAAAAVAVQAKKKRDSCAVVELYNAIVDLSDPSELTPDLVSAVGGKYGINMQKDDLDGLKKIYSQYVEALIPAGDTQLKGDEAPKIAAFKEALSLSDEDAAPVHIEVARRLFRQGYETKDRAIQFEQRKAFQRLIYVSQLVFGDQKAAFLLPWRRHFNITDAQVFVARRDNARTIFRTFMEQQGGQLQADRHFLRTLRDQQQAVKLMDESAVEVVKEAARKHAEVRLEKAISYVRANTKAKDAAAAVAEVNEVLEYSRKLAKYANEEDLIPGLGPVTIAGGALAQEPRLRDLKDLYKAYVECRMEAGGEYGADLEADARDLQAMLGLSAATAQGLTDEVAARLYKRLLRDEVTSGRLDAAASPAEVLGSLCERVRFSPEAALELHKGLYKTKLNTLLMEKKTLSDTDGTELARIRRILCLPADAVKKAQKDTVGKVLEEAISDIYMMGAKPVADSDLDKLDQVVKDMKIEPEVAQEIFVSVTRERLRSYVQQALKERGTQQDRKAEAAAIKKLVQFNAIVVTPLLDRIKGVDAAKKEMAELMAKAVEAAAKEGGQAAAEAAAAATNASREDQVKAVQKAMQAARGEFGEEERKGQKEITLRDDVSPENRALLYKDYLMHTMTGDTVELPVGGVIRRKTSNEARQADMARLQALADLLGMTQMEVVGVQADLAEQAYKAQATEVMRSGPMNEEKAQYLEQMRTQLGLPKEQADKALKAARTEVYGSAAAAEDGGRWTLERITDVVEKGGSVEGLVEEVTRRNLFRKEFERKVSDGSGTFDADYMLHKLPAMLGLEERKVKQIVKELVGTRKRMLLVQAVSQHRQRRPQDVATSLNNLLSATRAMPEKEPLSWTEPSELRELYGIFCAKDDDASKREELAALFGLSESDAEAARAGAGAKTSTAGGAAHHDDDAIF